MMTALIKLFAVLVSTAMMATGIPAGETLAAPVGRVVTVGNVVVSHNGAEVALSPHGALGIMTDGREAIYDFYLGRGDERALSFQLAANDDRLLLLNDDSQTTLSVTAGDLTKLLQDSGMVSEDDPEAQAVGEIMLGELLPAYVDVLRFMGDKDAVAAMDARSWALYDAMVDRGAGTPGQVEYEGALHDVQTYEYTLTGPQIGALADAMVAENDALSAYVTAYFKLLNAAPDETGLSGATNYETLFQKIDLSMRVSESIAENGLDMMHSTVDIAAPGQSQPMRYTIHQTRMGDDRHSTASSTLDLDGLALELYMEYSQDGQDAHTSMSVTGNAAETAAGTEEAEGDSGEEEASEGEGDAPDLFYITLEYDLSHDAGNTASEALNLTVDAGSLDLRAEVNAAGTHAEDGTGSGHVAGYYTAGDENYGLEFDATVTDEVFEKRVSEEGAQSIDGFDPSGMLVSLGASAMSLMQDESVQRAAELFAPAVPEAADEADAGEADGEAGELPFARPVFNWLPEDYVVESVKVDAPYEDVTCVLRNPKTGDEITVTLTTTYEDNDVSHYVVNGDNFSPVEGLLVTRESYGTERVYTADDGKVCINFYPTSPDTPDTDILNILIGLSFGEEDDD